MALSLENKVSDTDRAATNNITNPPDFAEGFEPSEDNDDGDFGSLFDDAGGLFGDSGLGNSSGDTGFGGNGGGFGDSSSLNGFNSNFNSMNGTNGNMNGMNGNMQGQPDNMDKAIDYSMESLVTLTHIIGDMFKSVGNRTCDDWALLGNYCMKIGVAGVGVGIFLALIGGLADIKILKFINMSSTIVFWGGLTLAGGLGCLSSMMLVKLNGGGGDEDTGSLNDIPDASEMLDNEDDADGFDNSYDGDDEMDDGGLGSLLDDIMGDTIEPTDAPLIDETPVVASNTDPGDIIKHISSTPMLNRKYLLDTLLAMFPENTPDFGDRSLLDKDTDEYQNIVCLLAQALASACMKDIDDLTVEVESIETTKFCYIIRFRRHKSINKKEEVLQTEIVNYFKGNADDKSVTATLKIEGPTYVCVLTKGVKAVITMGDCFKQDYVRDFYYDTGNKLPFILGVDDVGKVWLEDASRFPSLMIVGMSRSGKSWYVNSFILSLAAFNPPDTVQFLIIDPKETMLFKTVGLLPHCCGVHNDKNILNILSDILNKEAARRKRILADHGCDSLWDLRKKKNIMIPYLYIVIDEVITVINNLSLSGQDKEFLKLLIQIITQLPSLGIGVLMVPHRAQGIVDKTTRSQMHFRAAVRAQDEVVRETLDVNKWDRPLIEPGDIALRASSLPEPIYVKGTGVTLSDSDNIDLISNLARAYYKMGVELPDMETIGCGYNRDTDEIKRVLELKFGERVQFNIDDV